MQTHQYWQTAAMLLTALVLSSSQLSAQTQVSYIDNDWPDSRYTVNTNGTVVDNVTGLIWQRCSLGLSGDACDSGTAAAMTWDHALQMAAANDFAGFNDWRLPNIVELRSLAAYDRFNPAINATAFPATVGTRYWASSPVADFNVSAWAIDFSGGFGGGSSRSDFRRARLVRGGQ